MPRPSAPPESWNLQRILQPCAILALLTVANPVNAQNVVSHPDSARIVVEDVRLLADALRSLSNGGDSLAVLERDYLASGSPALRTYAARYGVTPESLRAAVARHGLTGERLDRLADSILLRETAFREAFRRLGELHPEAVFPPVWFIVGHMGPGGMTEAVGPIVAAERYLDRPEDAVPIALHELAHYQQVALQGPDTYLRLYRQGETYLLGLAVREGIAELIAKLTTGRHINPAAERYGLEHEAELWAEFREDLEDADAGEWMFVQPADPERPADLGYWIGYRIAKSWLERATDERAAVRELLTVSDFRAFLRESGYAEQVAETGGGQPAPDADDGRAADATSLVDLALVDRGAFARRVTAAATTDYERAVAVTRWFAENFDWTATDYERRTVEEILKRGGGNCDELARVTVAMLEQLGLPMRRVREINLHPESERRQRSAEAKIAESGPGYSVFGRRHNDHVWIEIQDRATGEWFPADPSLGVVGEQWLESRLSFGERYSLDPGSAAMIAPFAVFAEDGQGGFTVNRTAHYVVDGFDRLYGGRLRATSAWEEWVRLVDELDDLAGGAFRGETNLHAHAARIDRLAEAYEALRRHAEAEGLEPTE